MDSPRLNRRSSLTLHGTTGNTFHIELLHDDKQYRDGNGYQYTTCTELSEVRVDKTLIQHLIQTNGNYFNYSVFPTCGLSTTDSLIGEVDDPRYFAHPNHVDARILWFGRGFIDYRIPNMLPPGQKIDRLTLSFEISSEAPGVNSDWPSDISFFLNNTKVGIWTSPGDFGDVHGMFTPDWWFPNWNQYGLLKMLVIDRHGTFIDGLKISDVNTQQLTFTSQDDMVFRFQVDEPSQNIGGLTLFGKDFGNYNQDINVKVHYTPNV